jgi:hypothetical protein
MHLLHSGLVYLHLQDITLVLSSHTPQSSISVTQPIRSTWESAILSIRHVLLQVSHFKANVTLDGTVHTTRLEILGGEYRLVLTELPALSGMSLRDTIRRLDVCNTPTVSIALDGRFLMATKRERLRVQHKPAPQHGRVQRQLVRLLAGGAAETRAALVYCLYLRPPQALHLLRQISWVATISRNRCKISNSESSIDDRSKVHQRFDTIKPRLSDIDVHADVDLHEGFSPGRKFSEYEPQRSSPSNTVSRMPLRIW